MEKKHGRKLKADCLVIMNDTVLWRSETIRKGEPKMELLWR